MPSAPVGNKIQALMIDTDMNGSYDGTDLLLFVENWGGMLATGDLTPGGIFPVEI